MLDGRAAYSRNIFILALLARQSRSIEAAPQGEGAAVDSRIIRRLLGTCYILYYVILYYVILYYVILYIIRRLLGTCALDLRQPYTQ